MQLSVDANAKALSRNGRDRTSAPSGVCRLIQLAGRSRRKQAGIIVAHCLQLLPHYNKLPAELLTAVHDNVLFHVALFHRLVLEGRQVRPEELEPARLVARERARQGVPLGELFTFYQVGFTMIWEQLIALEAANPIERAELLSRMAAVVASHTQVTTATAEAYVEERERLSHYHEQDLDDFARLLLIRDAPESVIQERARALGIHMDVPRRAAFFCPPARAVAPGVSAELESTRRLISTWLKPLGGVVGRTQEGFIALFPDSGIPKDLSEIVDRILGPEGYLGLGGSGQDIPGICRSAYEAVRAVRLGALLNPESTLCLYDDFAIFDLVQLGSEDAGEFVRRVLGPLADANASAIHLRTLRELCRHAFCIKVAAAALSIHPNTLTYRMRQIRERFGIDLEGAHSRLQVHLALLIRDGSHALSSASRQA